MQNDLVKHFLAGKIVLIVEDEAIISFLLEDMMADLGGATINLAANVDEALAVIDTRMPDLAILDLNLGGELSYPVAERLEAMAVPFVFTTGYGRVDSKWSSKCIVQKPFDLAAMEQALRGALVGIS